MVEDSKTTKSPLAPISPFLKAYSWIGVYPIRANDSFTHFKVNWLTYLTTLVVFIIYMGACKLIDYLSEDQNDEETIFTSQSQFDRLVMNMYMKLNVLALTFLAVLNYSSIGKLTGVVTALGRISHSQSISTKKSLIHNAVVALSPVAAVIFLDMCYLLGGSEEAEAFAEANGTWLVAMVEVNKAIFVLFIGLLVSAPELVICFCQQILASETTYSCKASKLTPDELCQQLRLCLKASEALTSASGSILLVLLSMCSFELVIAAYYVLLHCFVLTGGTYSMPTFVIILDIVGNGFYCVSSLKRLFFLANNSQGIADAFQDAVDALLELERKEETHSHEVRVTRKVLERVQGVPVLGFFTINRSMILVVLGQVITYLIIMLEFKNGDAQPISSALAP